MGISLGAVNYCLKALMDRELVKAKNFGSSSNKAGYIYLLTPLGIAEKSFQTSRFLKLKMAEYEALRCDIKELALEASVYRD